MSYQQPSSSSGGSWLWSAATHVAFASVLLGALRARGAISVHPEKCASELGKSALQMSADGGEIVYNKSFELFNMARAALKKAGKSP